MFLLILLSLLSLLILCPCWSYCPYWSYCSCWSSVPTDPTVPSDPPFLLILPRSYQSYVSTHPLFLQFLLFLCSYWSSFPADPTDPVFLQCTLILTISLWRQLGHRTPANLGLWLELSLSGPHGNFNCGVTSFQRLNFSCAKSNASVTIIYFDWLSIVAHCTIGTSWKWIESNKARRLNQPSNLYHLGWPK